jgi:hypothetical protein
VTSFVHKSMLGNAPVVYTRIQAFKEYIQSALKASRYPQYLNQQWTPSDPAIATPPPAEGSVTGRSDASGPSSPSLWLAFVVVIYSFHSL